jgi:uncharacterized Tic20 family protein
LDPISIAFQFVAMLSTFASYWLIGNKNPNGPMLGVFSQFIWAAMNLYLGLYILIVVQVVSGCIQIRNFHKWRSDELAQR